MSKLYFRTLWAGVASPFAAAGLGLFVYRSLTRASADRDADFVFRLSIVAIAMALPGVITLVLALADHRKGAFSTVSKVGLMLGILSLGLVFLPIRGVVERATQARNLALSDVEAPPFSTADIHGNTHRLDEHGGKVVLVNVWATWCPPCRREMPDLDKLYQERKKQGFMVFGLSTEDLGNAARLRRKRPVGELPPPDDRGGRPRDLSDDGAIPRQLPNRSRRTAATRSEHGAAFRESRRRRRRAPEAADHSSVATATLGGRRGPSSRSSLSFSASKSARNASATGGPGG